jgi:prefoldin subunit 5
MRRSDIFESFAKIAQEQGIISIDAPDKAKEKLENNPRADSLSVKDLESLYNVKPDIPKDMQYKRNIVEDAHPTSVVVAPSYDKLNGLVENVNERQDILLNIVNKNTNGLLTQHKYAEKELVLSLVRIANDLDNKGNDELRVLADACLSQVSKKKVLNQKYNLKKMGVGPVAIVGGVAVGIAALIGGIYLHQHISNWNEGFEENHKRLVGEISDLSKRNTALLFGHQYKQSFVDEMTKLTENLDSVHSEVQNAIEVLNRLESIKTSEQLVQMAKSQKTSDVTDTMIRLRKVFDNVKPMLEKVRTNFQNPRYRTQQTEHTGWFQKGVEKVRLTDQKGEGLVASDFQDVLNALDPYIESVNEIIAALENSKSEQESAEAELRQTTTPTQPAAAVPSSAPTVPAAVTRPSVSRPSKTEAQKEEELLEELRGIV